MEDGRYEVNDKEIQEREIEEWVNKLIKLSVCMSRLLCRRSRLQSFNIPN